MCYKTGLTIADLEILSIGMCLDYIEEYIEQNKPAKQRKRKATQSDFDAF
jgi:hypothetical protein